LTKWVHKSLRALPEANVQSVAVKKVQIGNHSRDSMVWIYRETKSQTHLQGKR